MKDGDLESVLSRSFVVTGASKLFLAGHSSGNRYIVNLLSRGVLPAGVIYLDPIGMDLIYSLDCDTDGKMIKPVLTQPIVIQAPLLVVGSELCETQTTKLGCCPAGFSASHFYEKTLTSSEKYHLTAANFGHADMYR